VATPVVSTGIGPLELGVRLVSDVVGMLRAIRFWKAAGDTGLHVGRVWTLTGQLLSLVNFANETASGWQQQALVMPLHVLSGAPFVVSVSVGTAHYGLTLNTLPPVNGPIKATAAVYGTTGNFPAWTSPHDYYRDVIFVPDPSGGGTLGGGTLRVEHK
jgi:hypothetical protein